MADPVELEGKSKVDGAWYDCEISWEKSSRKKRPALRVHFVGFDEDEDEFIDNYDDAKEHLRPRSIPAEDWHCKDIKEGDITLTLQRRYIIDEKKYYDAEVCKIFREEHTTEGACCCSFLMRWKDSEKEGSQSKLHITSLCIMSPRKVDEHPLIVQAHQKWQEIQDAPAEPEAADGQGEVLVPKVENVKEEEHTAQNKSVQAARPRGRPSRSPAAGLLLSPAGGRPSQSPAPGHLPSPEEIELPRVSRHGRVIKQKVQVDMGDIRRERRPRSTGKVAHAHSPAGPSATKASNGRDSSQEGRSGTVRVESFEAGSGHCSRCGEIEDEDVVVTVNKAGGKALCLDCFISSQKTFIDPSEFVIHVKNLKLALTATHRLSAILELPKPAVSPQVTPQTAPRAAPGSTPSQLTPSMFVTPPQFFSPVQATPPPPAEDAAAAGGMKMRLKDIARHKNAEQAAAEGKDPSGKKEQDTGVTEGQQDGDKSGKNVVETTVSAVPEIAAPAVSAVVAPPAQEDGAAPMVTEDMPAGPAQDDQAADLAPILAGHVAPLIQKYEALAKTDDVAPVTGDVPAPAVQADEAAAKDVEEAVPMETTGGEDLVPQENKTTETTEVEEAKDTDALPRDFSEETKEGGAPEIPNPGGDGTVIKEAETKRESGNPQPIVPTEAELPPLGQSEVVAEDTSVMPPVADQVASVEADSSFPVAVSGEQAKADAFFSAPEFQVDSLGLDLEGVDVAITVEADETGSLPLEVEFQAANEEPVLAVEIPLAGPACKSTEDGSLGLKRALEVNGAGDSPAAASEYPESKRSKLASDEPVSVLPLDQAETAVLLQ